MDELPDGITHVLCVDKCRIIAQGSLSEILKNDKARELLNAKRGEKTPRVVRFARGKASRHGKDEIIRMENVSVRYGRKRILSDINWSVRRGESWALVGPNGSGKSTLLSLISGDNPKAYNNGISIFGKRRGSGESIWDLKRRTGLVSSELHLHVPVYQTSYETVLSGFTDSFFSLRSARSHQRAAAKQILNKFGLLPFWREPFGSLSEGQQRMVLLARALVKSPELLLLDEPCQGLDAAHQRIFLRFIESVVRESEATIVYVTHVPNEIPRGITNALRLQDGRIASITAG
jgi:molybdate transport system ATP-binding protein